MSDRPTPEQIHQALDDQHDGGFTSSATIDDYLTDLAEHGYVIVHPDDVPVWPSRGVIGVIDEEADGWNACRAHIFGD